MKKTYRPEQRIARLLRKRLTSGSGSAYMEFAFIAPLFLVCILIIFDILITLPRRQQLDIIARYYAEAKSFDASEASINMTFRAYQKKVPCIQDAQFMVTKEVNQKNRRYLVRGADIAINSLFEDFPDILKKIIGGALNAITLGTKKPYFDAFFEIDDCHHINVAMTVPALLGSNPELVDLNEKAEKALVTTTTISSDYYIPTRNTGLGRDETYITKVANFIRKLKPGGGG